MRKAIIALCLLTIVVGVTYIKVVRGSAREQVSYEQGKRQQSQDLIFYRQMVDSLRYLIGKQQVEFADSLVRKEVVHQARMDSVVSILDSLWAAQPATEKKADAGSADSVAEAKRKETEERHSKILSHYKRLYKDLPQDLSDYERKAALHEIRVETAEKFSVSLADLRAIRKKAGVTY